MDNNTTSYENRKKYFLKQILESTNNPFLNIKSLFKEELYGKKIEKKLIRISQNKKKFKNFLDQFKIKVKHINDTLLISDFLVETLKEFSYNKFIFVSPRKSGTHLISNLFRCNFYSLPFNGKLNICSTEAGYYSLTNTFHTSFNKFFYYLDRENFDGGKLLPLNNFLGILTCRHPADIFYSHINFSFANNNTSFANLKFKSEKEKLDFIINSNAYENFFKGLYDFTSWSRLSNFITIPFENLIDVNENYTSRKNNSILKILNKIDLLINQEDLKHIFNNSPTFYQGKIGLGIDFIKKNCRELFQNKYYKKYCDFYGYSYQNPCRPKNIEEINNKKIILNDKRPINTPITFNPNYMNYTIFYYNKNLYAKPKNSDYNFEKLINDENFYLKSKSYEEIKFKIFCDKKR